MDILLRRYFQNIHLVFSDCFAKITTAMNRNILSTLPMFFFITDCFKLFKREQRLKGKVDGEY